MRLATWNVYSGALCQPRLLALQEQILHMTCPTESSSSSSASPASQGVDVCCLQEVTAAAWAAWRRLKETFPYHVTSKQSCESSSADFFTAILSKYPLQDVKYVEFRNSPQERGLLLATVVPGIERVHDEGDGACRRRRRRATSAPPFVVATTHLESPLGVRGNNADRREEQLRFSLREISKQLESHTIATCLLLGDLNWHPHLHEPLDDVLGTVSHNDGSQQVQMQPPRSASGRGRRTRRRISADSTSSESHWQADGGSAGTIAWRDGWSMLGRGEEGGATYDSARCATCGDDKPGQSRLDRVVIGRRRHNAAVPGTSRMAEATPTSRLALRLSRMNDNDNDNDGGAGGGGGGGDEEEEEEEDYLLVGAWLFGAPLCSKVGYYSAWSLPPPEQLSWLYETTGDRAPPWNDEAKEQDVDRTPTPELASPSAPAQASPSDNAFIAASDDGDDGGLPTTPCTPSTPPVSAANVVNARRRAFCPSDHYGILLELHAL
ncbi:hypothetical protein PPROV_000767800 [Pycnococcus provasolii]|uniref:Endonuclease/exonuclease/phosphatase domain-containing protein n=2 Tax=Pycnococcus provasolii TaxID=41880 RepID=A0A830HTW8_9CHLO|nr:hypothetical protein PPROV_000767800 [Pycnococcus provasolii]